MTYKLPFAISELSYEDALLTLHETLKLGISPMLETVEDMLAELDNPDVCFEAIQIAGTNGKTSTSRYTAAILQETGLYTALYTSPELMHYTERMELAGSVVSEETFAHGVSAAVSAGQRVNARREEAGLKPYDITEFDLITVAAYVVFAEAGIDVAVLECGMGGRWDATSAHKSIKAVAVTGVGLDHMHVLGNTLTEIAGEKAAIIRAGRPCVLGVGTATPPEVEDVFLARCTEQGITPVLLRPQDVADAAGEMAAGELRKHDDADQASYRIARRPRRLGDTLLVDIETPHTRYSDIAALKPAYQAANIACAVALCEAYLTAHHNDITLSEDVVSTAVLSCPTPGRFDVVRPDPLGLIDACHNPQSVEAFLTAVRAIEPRPELRPTLVCAALADKDCKSMVELLAPEFKHVVVTQTSSPRALPAADLAALFSAAGKEPDAVYASVADAVTGLRETPFIACGSITLAGELALLMRS